MKFIKSFNQLNEAVILPNKEIINEFEKELKEQFINIFTIPFTEVKKIGKKYNIEVVDYNTFYNELPESHKKNAPTQNGQPVFALVNAKTGYPRIVYQVPNLTKHMIEMLVHMLEHETVHIGQIANRLKNGNYIKNDSDTNVHNKKSYFSDTDEIMAFSQSISNMLINLKIKSTKEGISKLKTNPLYNDIKKNVDIKVLKKYNKYIYQYLDDHFKK